MKPRLIPKAALFAACLVGLAVAQQNRRPQARGQRDRSDQPTFVPGGPPPNPLVAALDEDQDGTISAAEMKKAASALKTLDRNRDGKLEPDELRPSFREGTDRPGPDGAGRPGREGMQRGERGPGGPPGGPGDSVANAAPVPKDEVEKMILGILEDMNSQGRGMMSVPRDDGRFLRLLTESLGAKNIVEIGTSHGYSAIWLSLALRKTGGKLTTFEIDARRAGLARENFKRAGVESLITLVEGDAHEEVAKLKEPIDLLFLDADKDGYIDYLQKLLPLVRPGGLVVAHNMSQRQADPRYVEAITTNPDLETLFVNLGASGVGVTLKKR